MKTYVNSRGILWLEDGEYGTDKKGGWWCRPPGYFMTTLSRHNVTEHEDGTISVTPKITITVGLNMYSWTLLKGEWRKVA